MNSTNVPDTLEYHTTLGIDSKPSGATTPASQQPLVPAPVLDETPPYPILPRWHRILLISLLASSNLIDSSSLFNSLPGMYQMESELKMTVPAGQWMLNGWNMGVAISLLVSGRFADVYGAKWVYLVGLGTFTISSLIGGISHSSGLIIFARVIQGVGIGLAIPSSLKALLQVVTDEKEQSSVLGLFAAGGCVGPAIGAPLGAALFALSWRWPWYFIAVLGGILWISALFLMPTIPRAKSEKPDLDLVGLILVSAAVACLAFGILQAANENKFKKASVLVPLCISAMLFPAFILAERRPGEAVNRLIPPFIWRYPNFKILAAVALIPYSIGNSVCFPLFVFWRAGFGFTPLEVAWGVNPYGLSGCAVGLLSSFYPTLFRHRFTMPVGFVICAAAPLMASFQNAPARYWSFVFPAYLLSPVGQIAVLMGCYNGLIQSTPEEMRGVVAGLENCLSNLGTTTLMSLFALIQAAITAKAEHIEASDYSGIAWADRFIASTAIAIGVLYLICYRQSSKKGTDSEGEIDESGRGGKAEEGILEGK